MNDPHYRWDGDELLLRLRLSPRASRDKVSGLMGDRLKVSITAPPVDGKANAYLVKFIAKQFRVSPSLVTVEQGLTDRNKTVRITAPQVLPDEFAVNRDN